MTRAANSHNNNNNNDNRNENNPLPSHDCNYHHLQENAYEDFGIERKLVTRQHDHDRDGVPPTTATSSHKKMGIMARDIRLGKRNKNAHKKEKGATAPAGGGSGKGWWGAGAKKQSRQQSQQQQERLEDALDDRPRTPRKEQQQQQQQHKQYHEDKLQFPRPRTLSSPGILLRSSHDNSGRSGNSGDSDNVNIHNTVNDGNESPTNHHHHPWISMAGFHLKKTKSTPSKTLKSFRKSNTTTNNDNDNECIDTNNKKSPSRTSTTPHRKSYRNTSPQTRNPPIKKNRAEGDTALRLRSDRRRRSHNQDKRLQKSRNPNGNTTITTRETGQLPNASIPVDIDEISIGSSDSERDGGYTYYSAPTEGLLLRHNCYDDDPYGISAAVPAAAAAAAANVNINANDTVATGNRTRDTLQGNRTKAHTHPSTHATGGPTRNHHLDTERVLSQLGMELGEEDYCIEGEFGSRERMAKLQYHQHRLDSKRGHPHHHGERNRHGATTANNIGQQSQQDDVRRNSNSNNKNENQRSDKGVVPVQTMKKLARQTLESIRNRTHSEESGGAEAETMQQHGTGINKNKNKNKNNAVPSPSLKNTSIHTQTNQEGNNTPKLIFGSKVLALLRRHRNKHNNSNSNSNNYTLDKVPHQIITIVSSEDEEGNEIAITPEEMLLVQRWQMARARREGKSGYYGGYDDSIALGDGDYKGPVDIDEDDYDDDDHDAGIETSFEVGVGFPSPSSGDASFQSDHATYDSMYHVKSNEDVLSTTASSCDQTAIMDNRRRRRPKF